MKKYTFKQAVPVWENQKENEINYNLCFRVIIPPSSNCIIALSASNMYQMFVNGDFVAEGPARAGHGYYRVDEINLSEALTKEKNIICIYVDGYNVPNFYLINEPAFLCAEVVNDGNVIAATGNHGFEAKYHSDRLRKVLRYSYQRTFTEVYNYDTHYKDYEINPDCHFTPVKLAETDSKDFICRGIPYPNYQNVFADKIISHGKVEYAEDITNPIRDRVTVPESPSHGFPIASLDVVSCDVAEKCICKPFNGFSKNINDFSLGKNEFVLYAFEGEKTGFINLEVECFEKTVLIAVFDEVLVNGDINLRRTCPGNTTINVVIWNLQKGKYSLITNEPYSFKYMKIINQDGIARINQLYITEFTNNIKFCPLNSKNEKFNIIYKAAFETFRQNAVDLYTDCPSRERAGWLCDSFFTARVEKALTGNSWIEKNFLENFLLNKSNTWSENPMLPMCYPADLSADSYIPQWAMWFILELEEYYARTKDQEMLKLAKNKVLALMRYFESFENEYGLLENLQGWSFVEWSKANDFVNGVNYPTNMLYAKTLEAIYHLYGVKNVLKKSRELKNVIRRQSYVSGFFHDHALRDENGCLITATDDITETCQYYAFFTDTATPETFKELWSVLLRDFGPDRIKKQLWSNIYPSNAFIGYFLRLEILAKENERDHLLSSIEGFFYPMARATGTLWELNTQSASCNHGFASHVMIWLKKFIEKA